MRFLPLLLLLACTPKPDIAWTPGPLPPTPPLAPIALPAAPASDPLGLAVQARGDALRAWAAEN